MMARPPMRPAPTLDIERALFAGGCRRLAALDEVGRGALAGPVSVGAVVVTADLRPVPTGLRDSKLLTAAARTALVPPIRAWVVESAVGHAQPGEIDAVGIMAALRLAARRALAALSCPVDAVLLDGNYDYLSGTSRPPAPDSAADRDAATPPGACRFGQPIAGEAEDYVIPDPLADDWIAPVHLRTKADRDCASVAAASVLAKVTRDALMVDLAERFPAFGWADNKGYGTAAHLAAIEEHGVCEWHRRSWSLPMSDAWAAALPAAASPAGLGGG